MSEPYIKSRATVIPQVIIFVLLYFFFSYANTYIFSELLSELSSNSRGVLIGSMLLLNLIIVFFLSAFAGHSFLGRWGRGASTEERVRYSFWSLFWIGIFPPLILIILSALFVMVFPKQSTGVGVLFLYAVSIVEGVSMTDAAAKTTEMLTFAGLIWGMRILLQFATLFWAFGLGGREKKEEKSLKSMKGKE